MGGEGRGGERWAGGVGLMGVDVFVKFLQCYYVSTIKTTTTTTTTITTTKLIIRL